MNLKTDLIATKNLIFQIFQKAVKFYVQNIQLITYKIYNK